MATATLRALSLLEPKPTITCLIRRPLRDLIDSCPWVDRIVTITRRNDSASRGAEPKRRSSMFPLASRLRAGRFDTAILLTNSFRSALLVRMARIPRRVGYDRDGRGFLLTDRLLPRREAGRFVPVPTREYYLATARYLGAQSAEPAMSLFTSNEHDEIADRLLERAGVRSSQPLVVMTPGANFGDAKLWLADRFAAVADMCVRRLGAAVAVAGAPKERRILDAVVGAAHEPLIDLLDLGVNLDLLKSVIRRSHVVITNDTGPRHIAAAFSVPVVTIFGPTDPAWTEIDFEHERKVMVDVFCGPCQKKRCPLDHRCMEQIGPEVVFEKAAELVEIASRQKVGT